tara:strand:+ start:159 stop:317 length:159 start_codon:yes stop_codon:yes gene_type:complete
MSYEKRIDKLREGLLNLAWDCQSGWLDNDGVDNWSDEKIEQVCKNIKQSLTL